MAKTYKVWIEIEEYDEETGIGEDCTPFDLPCTSEFSTCEEAVAFATTMHNAHTNRVFVGK